MILKARLTTQQFAGLAQFLASEENGNTLLKELCPSKSPFFVNGHSRTSFATILKSTPKDGGVEVAILASELCKADYDGNDLGVPSRYIENLFKAMAVFPTPIVGTLTYNLDWDSPPLPYTSFSGMETNQKGAVHLGMGIVTLEKRTNGRLYVNGVEIIRRPLSETETKRKIGLGDRGTGLVNACLLDAFAKDRRLIPDDWDGCGAYFRGTTYAGGSGDLYARGFWFDKGTIYYHNGHIGGHNWGRDPLEAVLDL
jgi:hypothetical protein